MFKLILEKELKEIIGTTKFAVTFGVCAILILLAFFVGARNYQVSRQSYDASVVQNLKQMEGLTDWQRVSHRIFLPPQPLAALVSGISNDIGRTINVRARGELSSQDSRFNEDPIFAVFRFLDLEFIFTIVLSLFAILFGYDAINGEKERGTLRLSFSNSIPREKYILGKIFGSFMALIVPLLIPILIGCALLPLLGVPMDSESWIRLAMIVLTGVLYFGVFLTLSVMVSALTEKSSSSFLMLLVIWIFAVLIVPRSSVLIAAQAVDVPSLDQIDYEKSKYSRQLSREMMNAFDDFRSETDRTDRETFMQAMQDFMSQQADEREEKMRVLSEQLNEQRDNKVAAQQRLALAIARISPTASFSLAASNLASTSLVLRSAYMERANDYQREYAAFLTGKDSGSGMFITFSGGDDDEPEPDPIDPTELPVFTFEPPSTSTAINSSLFDIGLLMLFNVVFFVASFVAFLRYDVR